METALGSPNLNEQQLDMLRLLRNPLPKEYFQQLRRLAVQLLGKQLDEVLDNWEENNDITESDYEKLSKEHFRTPYKKS
ncbi:hypothetical protein [Arachidicoccus terrestris]|uniref:hypothetical protein n=1 Tax=Arachidicoccus terrestris TaxID=2875539 RepID=UPI001CC65418|nr:hypothetical protein [Arachidicoccus terrestris]UAY55500.1 hypothetical protein K9M52_00225 [Arachidicoccus terrestris]